MYISDKYKDCRYSDKLASVLNKYNDLDLKEVNTKEILLIRKKYLYIISSQIKILESFVKNKSSKNHIYNIFYCKYYPTFQVIKKYLEDAQVIIENALINNIIHLIYEIDESRRNFLKQTGSAALAHILPKSTAKLVGRVTNNLNSLENTVKDVASTYSTFNKTEKLSKLLGVKPEDGLKDPSRRLLLAAFAATPAGQRTTKRVYDGVKKSGELVRDGIMDSQLPSIPLPGFDLGGAIRKSK